MKNMKRFFAMVLAVMMVLSMATVASADETETVTTYQYEVYQIFTGDFSDGVLSNVKWGQNGKLPDDGKVGDAVADDVLAALEAVDAAASNSDKLDVILNYADLNSTALTTTSSTEKTVTISNLPNGYYLVKDVDKSLDGKNDAYTTYVVEVVNGEMTITRKADVPEVVKKIVEGEKKVDENEASIGDTVNYEITGTLPTNIADYDTYYYVFTDTLTKGLTYTNNLKVTVNDVEVTKYFWDNAPVADENGNYTDPTSDTVITVGIQDLLALELIDTDPDTEGVQSLVGDITAATKVVITYTAELNENAVVGDAGNPNIVDLEYSNDPNNDGDGATNPPPDNPGKPETNLPTGKTPEDKVITYTTEIIIKKVDENGKILTGAAFKIEGEGVNVVVVTAERYVENENGEYWKLADGTYTTDAPIVTGGEDDNSTDYANTTTKYALTTVVEVQGETEGVNVEAYVGKDGTVKFTGLGEGTYTITETVTPAGYNTVAPFAVTIKWNGGNSWTYTGTDEVEVDGNKVNINQVTVVNKAGSTLPETGGMGTTLFYIVGGVLVLAAVVLLVTKKRMAAAE